MRRSGDDSQGVHAPTGSWSTGGCSGRTRWAAFVTGDDVEVDDGPNAIAGPHAGSRAVRGLGRRVRLVREHQAEEGEAPVCLSGRVAVVTGAASGIGRAVALGLSREGAAVVVADVDAGGALRTQDDIAQAGGQSRAVQCDVTSSSSVSALIDGTVAAFGQVDILANIAGIYPRSRVVEMSEGEWDGVLAVNLKGVFLTCRAALRHMIPRNFGRIVNVASGIAIRGAPRGAHYAASKAGIIAFTASLAKEVADHDINVNAIAPGLTDTPMARRSNSQEEIEQVVAGMVRSAIGVPEDVVEPLIFLVTEGSRVMTGQVLWLRSP